jgi:2-iminoacetate synthase
MEFSVPGFIKRFCTPNAILTLSEYIVDYANNGLEEKGWSVIENNLAKLEDEKLVNSIQKRIDRIKQGERDLYY